MTSLCASVPKDRNPSVVVLSHFYLFFLHQFVLSELYSETQPHRPAQNRIRHLFVLQIHKILCQVVTYIRREREREKGGNELVYDSLNIKSLLFLLYIFFHSARLNPSYIVILISFILSFSFRRPLWQPEAHVLHTSLLSPPPPTTPFLFVFNCPARNYVLKFRMTKNCSAFRNLLSSLTKHFKGFFFSLLEMTGDVVPVFSR